MFLPFPERHVPGMTEHAQRRIVGESVHAAAGGVNQHGGRAIHDISRATCLPPGRRNLRDRVPTGVTRRINRENRTRQRR